MPLLLDSHDFLPYIDVNISAAQLDAAARVLAAELSADTTTTIHPSISTSYDPTYSQIISAAHEKIVSGHPSAVGLDLTRYEELSAPEDSSDTSAWRASLRTAYIAQAFLTERQLNLSLLDKYGKNAWLIGNSQVEEQLKQLEKEMADAKRQLEELEEERRQKQDSVSGEMEGLEQSWRATVGRAIEAEVAAEGLRRQILQRQRGGE